MSISTAEVHPSEGRSDGRPSLASSRSRKQSSTKFAEDAKETTVELHESLDEYDLEILYEIFLKQPGKQFDAGGLREVLQNVGKIVFSDEDYNVMFMKMNTERYCHSTVRFLLYSSSHFFFFLEMGTSPGMNSSLT